MVGKPLAFHHALLVSIQDCLSVRNYGREPAWMGRIRHLWGCDSRSDNATRLPLGIPFVTSHLPPFSPIFLHHL
ncbi:hypothetical protein Lalb_Chr24g0401601 [Lupinus albus]|uniref:Uncharacterized protein n=1 Tax=Lupinus albus TaxID=3870 RepID=A0A6A4NCG2_LUPAL|nr:hypothetical protein Lalb_Chr24g0401601 [Lupinus albus]